jgi:hypothetical protein
MIDITELTDAAKGKLVRYTPPHKNAESENGTISSWNGDYVFVRYGGPRVTPAATDPERLEFVTELRVQVTVHIRGRIATQETLIFPLAEGADYQMQQLAQKHMQLIGNAPHQIEFNFLDEPDPEEQYFRCGTDSNGVPLPMMFRYPR